jgi:hypothetical protein
MNNKNSKMIASVRFLHRSLEAETGIFLQNIGISLNYTVLHCRWWCSLTAHIFIPVSAFHLFVNGTVNVHQILNFKTWIDQQTILDNIHRPVFYLKHVVSKTGFCLGLQGKPTQVGPIDRASLSPDSSKVNVK